MGGGSLYQFDVCQTYFPVAVVALKGSPFLAKKMEARLHRLVVGDAFMIVATDNAHELFRHLHLLLLHHLVVTNHAERNVWCHNGELVDLVVGKELLMMLLWRIFLLLRL